MSFIMVNPNLAVVNELQSGLIATLEKYGIDVAPLPSRQARTLSGGFHCTSLDIRRKGTIGDHTL